MDVFFYEAFAEEVTALKQYMTANISAGFTPKTIQEDSPESPPAPIISIRTQSVIPHHWRTRLSGILTRSTGFDHLLSFALETGNNIQTGYLPLYCSRSVAEQAMILWMSVLRKLPKQIKNFTTFDRDGLTGSECENKRLVVFGVGNIGCEVCRIGTGLGMEVYGVDIVERHQSVSYVTKEEGLNLADIIVCSMNLTQTNNGYFAYDTLKLAQKGVVFVNVARGELSPSADLLRLIDEGHISGAGLDVYDNESKLAVQMRTNRDSYPEDILPALELANRHNVIMTPHNAFNTAEALDRKASQSIEQLKHFIETGSFIWGVPV